LDFDFRGCRECDKVVEKKYGWLADRVTANNKVFGEFNTN